jgi:polyhydroxyalkanoate synthesis regulator phasin
MSEIMSAEYRFDPARGRRIGEVVLDEMRRLALFTTGVAELTRNRAEQIVKTMMSDSSGAGAPAMVRQLLETSRHNRQELLRLIGAEIRDQVESLGLATARDLERIERRVDRLEKRVDAATRAAKKTSAKKTAAKTTRTRAAKTSGGGGASSGAAVPRGPVTGRGGSPGNQGRLP